MSPRLSVVVPTRDRAPEMENAVRSVLAQGFRDLEVVVVDDSSSDTTADAVGRLATDRRVRYVRNDGPGGPGGARNRGIAVATGELVSFCDDDDEWLPGAAGSTVEALEADPGAVLVAAWHEVHHVATGSRAVYRGPLEYGHAGLLWRNFPAIVFGVVRRSALGEELCFDPLMPTSEDWDLWVRCSAVGRVRTLPLALYRYRQHPRARVTGAAEPHRTGRQMFLEKHADRMTAACRYYHDAVIGLLDGRRHAAARLAAAGRKDPADAALAALLWSSDGVASRAGTRRSDPGLPARWAAQLLQRAPRRRVELSG